MLARSLLFFWVNAKKEEKAMNKKILVPLGRYDRIEEMNPCVEKVARPGMKVVFLVSYPVDGFRWPKEEVGMRAAFEATKVASCYSWEANLERAKKKIAPAAEAFHVKGIEVAVEVYTGSLNRAVRVHAAGDDVHLIMTRAGIADWIARLFNGTLPILQLFTRDNFTPIRLMQPPDLR
jgi:hypothetical protein